MIKPQTFIYVQLKHFHNYKNKNFFMASTKKQMVWFGKSKQHGNRKKSLKQKPNQGSRQKISNQIYLNLLGMYMLSLKGEKNEEDTRNADQILKQKNAGKIEEMSNTQNNNKIRLHRKSTSYSIKRSDSLTLNFETSQMLEMSEEQLTQKYNNDLFFRSRLDLRMKKYRESALKKKELNSIILGKADSRHVKMNYLNMDMDDSKNEEDIRIAQRTLKYVKEEEVDKLSRLWLKYIKINKTINQN